MRVSERLAIVDKIGRELQSRYTYKEIDHYLAAFNIEAPKEISVNSKWVYSKEALKNAPIQTIAKIAEDLELGTLKQAAAQLIPPAIWSDTFEFQLFISHISKDKRNATRLKEALIPYGINGFVAHEDIHPTLEWQSEIERALYCMDALVAIHTEGFSKSFWTQQEIGFALGRGIKVISLRMGEDPMGFIARHQALSRSGKTAEQVANEIDELLMTDELTSIRLAEAKTALGIQVLSDRLPF